MYFRYSDWQNENHTKHWMQHAVVATSCDGLPQQQPLTKGDKQRDVSVVEEMEQEYETAKEQ